MTSDRLSPVTARPYDGPRWRVAVLRADGSRGRHTADAVIEQLRDAGCMAVEHDPARIDPFVDVETQWAPAVDADAYDLVVSVGALLPSAVALAAVSGAPIARIPAAAGATHPSLPTALTSAPARTVPTLVVTANGSRHVTANAVDVSCDRALDASFRLGDRAWTVHGTDWSITPLATAAHQITVTGASGADSLSAEEFGIDLPAGTVRLDLDGRSRRVHALTIRCHHLGLQLLELAPTTGTLTAAE